MTHAEAVRAVLSASLDVEDTEALLRLVDLCYTGES